MSEGRSNIAILADAIRLQCHALRGGEDGYYATYPRPGEPIMRHMHVGEYMIVIFRKHPDDVFPMPEGVEKFNVEITAR